MNNLNMLLSLEVIYTGLAFTLVALLVATIANRWSPRVFFLLALRLAIGWQFLFEGLYKVQSHYGAGETTKAFSSEPYFRVAPGPIGERMRRQFDDPSEVIAEKVKPTRNISPATFAKLPLADQADACPQAVAQQLDSLVSATGTFIKSEGEKQLASAEPDLGKAINAITKGEEEATKEAKSEEEKNIARIKADEERKKAKSQAEAIRQDAQEKIDTFEKLAQKRITEDKAYYARWVYGAEGRNSKVKFINGDVALTGPERLAHIDWLRNELKAAEERQAIGLGNGNNIDSKHLAELRMDLITSESDLAKDANSFVAELKKELTGKAAEEAPKASMGQTLDLVTMWFLVVVGAFLMAGFLTRLSCLMAAGFLIMTYLAHPPFPWYPLPPNTEGNPLFINKNIIECVALLALACMPTGRWMGLDALVLRPFCRYKGECYCPPPVPSPTAASARR